MPQGFRKRVLNFTTDPQCLSQNPEDIILVVNAFNWLPRKPVSFCGHWEFWIDHVEWNMSHDVPSSCQSIESFQIGGMSSHKWHKLLVQNQLDVRCHQLTLCYLSSKYAILHLRKTVETTHHLLENLIINKIPSFRFSGSIKSWNATLCRLIFNKVLGHWNQCKVKFMGKHLTVKLFSDSSQVTLHSSEPSFISKSKYRKAYC